MDKYTPAELTNALVIGHIEYPRTVVQITDNDQIIGALIIDKQGGKMRFEGDVDKSAQMFFDEVTRRDTIGDQD